MNTDAQGLRFVTMSFQTDNGKTCVIDTDHTDNHNPLTISFYHKPCKDESLFVSWGHDFTNDSGVMTVEE